MKYTVRFAHMEKAPTWKVGDTIKTGDIIGKMGTSGQSTAAHLHTDCVHGFQDTRYTLRDIEGGAPESAPRQMNLFIDKDLFRETIVITTYYNDPSYMAALGKVHLGYDVVPVNRKEPGAPLLIYWNRSMSGKVLKIDDDPKGYGHCLYVGFEA